MEVMTPFSSFISTHIVYMNQISMWHILYNFDNPSSLINWMLYQIILHPISSKICFGLRRLESCVGGYSLQTSDVVGISNKGVLLWDIFNINWTLVLIWLKSIVTKRFSWCKSCKRFQACGDAIGLYVEKVSRVMIL